MNRHALNRAKMRATISVLTFMRALLLLCLFGAAPVWAAENPPPAPIMIPSPPAPAIALKLEEATRDLTMPSETDAPFRVVYFASDAPSLAPDEIAKLAGAPADATVETRELSEFFQACATEEGWMDDDEKRVALRLAALRDLLLSDLVGVQVVMWGESQKQVAIIGKTPDEDYFAGLLTFVVET